MIDSAETVFLVADSTKIGKSSFASLGAMSLIDYVITDSGIKEEDKKLFKNNEIEIIVAN